MQLFVGFIIFFSMHLATCEDYDTGNYTVTVLLIKKCETCSATGSNCSGPIAQCLDNYLYQKCCSFLLSETRVGETILTTVKRCIHKGACFVDPFSVNMGQGRIARGKIGCCLGVDTCETSTPKLPPVNFTLNGKRCPACYSLTGSCPKGVAYCTGSEDHCLDLAFTSRIGTTSSNLTMKGCTTASVCGQLKEGYLQFGGTDVVIHKSECNQAPPSTGCSC